MQTEKSRHAGQWIMPETRLTEFPVLSVDQRVRISPLYRRLMIDYFSSTGKIVVFITIFLLFVFLFLQITLYDGQYQTSLYFELINQHLVPRKGEFHLFEPNPEYHSKVTCSNVTCRFEKFRLFAIIAQFCSS